MSNLGNKEIFSRNLKHYMAINNKGRNEICESLKIPYTTFTDWEKGNIYPRIDKIEMLANYFGIKKSNIIEDNGLDTKNQPQELSFKTDIEELIECYKVCSNEDREELLMFARYKALKNTIAATGGELA